MRKWELYVRAVPIFLLVNFDFITDVIFINDVFSKNGTAVVCIVLSIVGVILSVIVPCGYNAWLIMVVSEHPCDSSEFMYVPFFNICALCDIREYEIKKTKTDLYLIFVEDIPQIIAASFYIFKVEATLFSVLSLSVSSVIILFKLIQRAKAECMEEI